ncbi:DNA excision repair protein ERCC-5 homolog [Maniola hyperantus]|uniref:DNA excision repair protein ERCC-5 homolog n=1 Tax=Aphantopus hyperantus TaxID=2795564 RepID=UPI001567E770|nr:DNA repair protein complementing XP-G cells homolog [Maniola hyperantus]
MGVTGLWRLIEPAGKPVPVETLENKVLAVDISIWLHQMVKGYQDAKGAPLPNAHLMGLFQRLCKLLYFRIKPVFVFDGAFPDLKKETIAKRQDNKSRYNSQSEKLKREIALLLGKKTAISALLGKQISPKKNKPVEDSDDLFKLPALPDRDTESESESDDEQNSSASTVDLHSVDLESDKFKNMPLKDKYDLLVELKETRKMNSWGKIHTLPKKSDNFSDFQMQRLLKRRKLQECLEETEKEIGDGGMSLAELESLLNEEGIDTKLDSLPGRRIASNNTTRYLLISNVKQALEAAKKKETETAKLKEQPGTSTDQAKTSSNQDELEDDLQKAIKMSLECVDESDTSACTSKTDDSWTSVLTDSDYSDDEDDDGFQQPDMSSAKAYIMQYSDFTPKAIDNIVTSKQKDKNKLKETNIDDIIEELNQEKTIIEDNIELTSSDEEIDRESVNKMDTTDTQSILVEKNVTDNIKIKDLATQNKNDNLSMNDTQQSVVFVENSTDDIILLETSLEDTEDHNSLLEQPISKVDLETESTSEDDFEEVSDNEQKLRKTAIELTLNMGKEVEDDIFADIFENNDKKLYLLKTSNSCNSPLKSEKSLNISEPSVDIGLESNLTKGKQIEQKGTKPVEILQNKLMAINTNTSIDKQIDETPETSTEILQNENQGKERPSKINLNEITEINEKSNREVITVEKLNSLASEIENEEEDLLQEKGRLDRIGRNITQQMTKEAQELLQVFGIPYIVAPMEAEAQCAFLENAKLTDGTITDDSDIWLFGGKTVYKNFFNQKKHVLQFLSERIEKSFNLSREQLVLLALLVGSDYTTGVSGVGPVTALEILASFPFNKKKLSSEQSKQALYQELVTGLLEFKKWVKAGKRTDNVSLKKKLKNVSLTDDFPSVRVVQAYMEPNIERSEEKFSWGELDITILRDYTKAKFGWSQNKLDEIIKPVLKRLLDRKNQKTVYDYFKRKLEFQSLEDQMSKRVKAAVQKMGPEGSVMKENDNTEIINDKQKTKRKRKTKTKDSNEAGPSKLTKHVDEIKNIDQVVKSTVVNDSEKVFNVNVQKSERYQEIIPQREKDKQHILENKLKAIELFRKTKIDRKTKKTKRKLPVPKEKAELSESDSD